MDVAGELDVGETRQKLLEHHADLELGQVGAEAEVRATAAECDVLVGRARDVEQVRVVESTLAPRNQLRRRKPDR